MVREFDTSCRRKKARPGTTTEQAKFNKPISDWISRKVTFLRLRKVEISVLHFSVLHVQR